MVIENPYAGKYAEDLPILIAISAELVGMLANSVVTALEMAPGKVKSNEKEPS